MRRRRERELLPPEEARSYEEFCKRAAREEYGCKMSSTSGWNLAACVAAGLPLGFAIVFTILLVTDPQWHEFVWAYGLALPALWLFSFPMRTACRNTPRYAELQEMWKLWHGWLERDAAPRYESQVEGFTGPDGAPSPVWRIQPNGEVRPGRELSAELASTWEQFRCRRRYEVGLCLVRPWLGWYGQNIAAWLGLAVTVVCTVACVGAVGQSGWYWVGAVGFGVLSVVVLAVPFRDLRHDVGRLRQLRRLRIDRETQHARGEFPAADHPAPWGSHAD